MHRVLNSHKKTIWIGIKIEILNDLVKNIKKNQKYDCVVPVVGDAETFTLYQKY